MEKRGVTDLPLHGGKAPWWLLTRMKGLAANIVDIVIDEYGEAELIRRLSDPYWFQALSCALAYDWHSSGTTTVMCGVLKSVIDPTRHGMGVAGGKGRHSAEAPEDIAFLSDLFGLGSRDTDRVLKASRIAAKVDNVAVQDGYDIYHHCVFLGETGSWAVIQQGLNVENKYARRYQWHSDVGSFVIEPHTGISGRREDVVLDLTSKDSLDAQGTIKDIVNEEPTKVERMMGSLRESGQAGLERWMPEIGKMGIDVLKLPSKVNWSAIRAAYEWKPKNFEEVLEIKGMGAKTIRGLALVSQIIYGDEPSWRDPVRFSFAYGGKDGVPFPVERRAMDESISFLRGAIEDSRADKKEKIDAFKRLEVFANFIAKK
ncbi:MAG: DUF763 domain-containing protein [Candidatus Methanofastidiosa archaeon]|nr:DUF763 domain-containing protein [Candidatus Methanofastidiosa archaeon]